jgi:hypothetical protein
VPTGRGVDDGPTGVSAGGAPISVGVGNELTGHGVDLGVGVGVEPTGVGAGG